MAIKEDRVMDKYKDFAYEYARTLNVKKTCEKCGISIRQGYRLMNNKNIRKIIDEELEKINSEKIADGKEVMEYLTSIMRGEHKEQIALTVGVGEGMSEVAIINKEVNQKDRIKAAELLGKVYGIYTNNVDLNSNVQVVFENEKDLED